MLLKTWYFITLVLAALLLGTTFGHALELPAKMKLDGPFWMLLQHRLYVFFHHVGAPIEIGAIVAAAVLSYLLRSQSPGFLLALSATVLLFAAFVAWLIFTRAANVEIAHWTAASLPQDWTGWRRRWEYSHLARFVMQSIAFCVLVASLLVESKGGGTST